MRKSITTLLLLYAAVATAQQTAITGKVFNAATSQPLRSATVAVQGTAITTITDADGTFALQLSLPATLSFSHTGFTTLLFKIDSALPLPLTIRLLENAKELEGVVVSTGYQVIPKERATGSFIQLSNTQLTRQAGTSIINMIESTVNALSFDKRTGRGQNPSLSIRGRSTIFGSADPLIVVDGFAWEGNISTINPNDVESITFLKDAAAASIWGVKAGNGVIVIITKKGKFDQPASVQFNSNITIGAKPGIMRLNTISSSDFIDMEQFLFSKGFYTSQETATNKPYLSPVIELLIKKRDGLLTPAEADAQVNALRNYDVRKDFNQYLYNSSLNQQHSINVKGGGKQMAYYLSAGLDDNKDQSAAAYKRITVRTGNTCQVGKSLQLDFGLAYTETRAKAGRPAYSEITTAGAKQLLPYARLAGDNGEPLATGKDYRVSFIKDAESKGLLNWEYKPLEELNFINNTSAVKDVLVNTSARFNITNGLQATAAYQYQTTETNTANLLSQQTYFTRDLINKYTQVNGTGAIIKRPVPLGAILNTAHADAQSYTLRAQLNYNKQWQSHEINLLAGSEIRERKSGSYSNRTYGYNDDVLTSVAVNYDSSYKLYSNPGTTLRIPVGNSFSSTINRYTSVYFNGAYTFSRRYTASFSARKDGSNLFGVDANQKFVPLWSAGAAWQINKEQFYHIKWLPLLKLRVTYGYSGNTDNSLSAYTTVNYSTGNINNGVYAIMQTPPNPSLQWERTAMFNIGLDFETNAKRITGSIEYYRKKSDHLIGEAPVDPTTGVLNITAGQFLFKGNVAEMKGSGVDVELRTLNINKRLKWNTVILFSYTTNKVSEYLLPPAAGSSFVNSSIGVIPAEGYPVYTLFSYKWAGLDATGDPQGYYNGQVSKDWANITGKATLQDLVYHGPALPPVFGSLQNEWSYKNFSLSANITWRLGYYFRRNGLSYSALFNSWNGANDYANRWQKAGDELHTDVPAQVYPAVTARDNFYLNSEALIERADNIRLKDLRVNYDIAFTKKQLAVKHLQLYLYANNIAMLWKATKTNIDPDILFEIPQPFTLTFGVKANF